MLDSIQTTIKEEQHSWHYREKIVSDIKQKQDEPVHTLNSHIMEIVTNCMFTNN